MPKTPWMNFGVLLGFSSSFLIDDWHRSSLLPDLAARRWIWQSLILGSDQTFVILVLFMEMLLWLLNVHSVISTISTWFFFFFHLPPWDANMNKDQLSSWRSRVNVHLLTVETLRLIDGLVLSFLLVWERMDTVHVYNV